MRWAILLASSSLTSCGKRRRSGCCKRSPKSKTRTPSRRTQRPSRAHAGASVLHAHLYTMHGAGWEGGGNLESASGAAVLPAIAYVSHSFPLHQANNGPRRAARPFRHQELPRRTPCRLGVNDGTAVTRTEIWAPAPASVSIPIPCQSVRRGCDALQHTPVAPDHGPLLITSTLLLRACRIFEVCSEMKWNRRRQPPFDRPGGYNGIIAISLTPTTRETEVTGFAPQRQAIT